MLSPWYFVGCFFLLVFSVTIAGADSAGKFGKSGPPDYLKAAAGMAFGMAALGGCAGLIWDFFALLNQIAG